MKKVLFEKNALSQSVVEQLQELAEPKYQKFACSLLPGVDHVLGVRFPFLRRIAKNIARGDWQSYLTTVREQYFEELLIQAMIIGYIQVDIEEILPFIKKFIPKINNWSVCDTFCQGLKITVQHREKMWSFLQPYLVSTEQYEVRFGVVMILTFFVRSDYRERIFTCFNRIDHEGYYVQMAVAWAISICYKKMPMETLLYLQDNQLDDVTYAKSLQKIRESLQSDEQTKALMTRLKAYRKRFS